MKVKRNDVRARKHGDVEKEESSIPKKPCKVGRVNKELIGRSIRVGYYDGPYEDGIITSIGNDRQICGIEFVVLTGRRKGVCWSVDCKSQIIAIGDVAIPKFKY